MTKARESPMVLDVSQDLAPIFSDRLATLSDLPDWIPLHPFGQWMGNGEKLLFDEESFDAVQKRLANNGNDWHLDIEHDTVRAEEDDQIDVRTAGYITELKLQDNFVYGKVEWTEKVAQQVLAGEWRYISPVLYFDRQEDGQWHVSDYHSFALVKRAGTHYQRKIGLSAHFQEGEPPVEKVTIGLAVLTALSLAEDASEKEAVKRIQLLASNRDAVLTLAGESDFETAMGKLAAWKLANDQVASLTAKVESFEKGEKERLIKDAMTGDKPKLAPSQKEWAETLSLSALKSFLEHAPGVLNAKKEEGADKADDSAILTAEELHVAKLMGRDPAKLAASKKGMVA